MALPDISLALANGKGLLLVEHSLPTLAVLAAGRLGRILLELIFAIGWLDIPRRIQGYCSHATRFSDSKDTCGGSYLGGIVAVFCLRDSKRG